MRLATPRPDERSRASDLIYDWNQVGLPLPPQTVEVEDEALRDGLQYPAFRNPSVQYQLKLLYLMVDLGADSLISGCRLRAKTFVVTS